MKPWTIHAIVPPGLEELAQEELSELGFKSKVEPGHLVLGAHPDGLYRLNHLARIPSRFLVVVGSFRATHFVEFKKKITALPLAPFMEGRGLSFSISCQHCKLFHTGAIEEAALRAFDLPSDPNGVGLYLRGKDDVFSVSVDSSGEHLHRRGILLHRGEAPLRENLAAAIVRAGTSFSRGVEDALAFWDPCCGSGTLLVEKLLLEQRIPLGRFRSFSFEQWPSLDLDRYKATKEKMEAEVKPWKGKILGSDVDAKVLDAAKFNLEKAGLLNSVELFKADMSQVDRSPFPSRCAIVSNPPYSERLKRGKEVLRTFKSWVKSSPDWRVFVLLPSSQRDQGRRSLLSFRNGGRPVELLEI